MITNGVTIKVGGSSYHSWNDFNLAIGNNNYIGAPEVDTHYVDIPGMNGFLDLSEVIAGRPTYTHRGIKIEFGGKYARDSWDSRISYIRGLFHGKNVQLIFDNDSSYYYEGRAYIEDFDRFRELGTFTLSIPNAAPFKYAVTPAEDGPYTISAGTTKTLYIETPEICKGPYVIVTEMYTGPLSVVGDNVTHTVTTNGTYYFPEKAAPGYHYYNFSVTAGNCKVKVSYEAGEL